MENVIVRIPADAEKIIAILEQAGYEAYVVGGCVRDSILGREPGDWDITTSASPEQVKALFPRTIDTGIVHGTVTVMLNHVGYEVTTYRVDGVYEDGRHPKSVTFTRSLSEDLLRRDFTINAMAYNPRTGLVDLYDGIGDLHRGCIRCVGNPTERFSEDALRILRALRFASQLDFAIADDTLSAMQKLAPKLSLVSAERVRVELVKLLGGKRPDMLITAFETGVTDVILQEWNAMITTSQDNPHHFCDVGRHTIRTIEAMHKEPEYLAANAHERMIYDMAMLLHDAGKPLCRTVGADGREHFYGHPAASAEVAKKVLRRLKFDNDTTALVTLLVRNHDCRFEFKPDCDFPKVMRHITSRIGLENMHYLFPIMRADIEGQHRDYRERGLARVAQMEEEFRTITQKQQCVSIRDLAVSGRDLIALGYAPGPALGDALSRLLQIVLDDPSANTAERLSELAAEWLSED